MADGSVPPPPPPSRPVWGWGGGWGLRARRAAPPLSRRPGGPGQRRGRAAPLREPRRSANWGPLSSPVWFHLTPNAITEVEWFEAAELGLGFAWLSGRRLVRHPPPSRDNPQFLRGPVVWESGPGYRPPPPPPPHPPPSFAQGQSRERCFDAEIASQPAWTCHLSIFNCFCKNLSMCEFADERTFGFSWCGASGLRNGFFFIHCEILDWSYRAGVSVWFCYLYGFL